jgi:hypothetical protein
VNPPRSNVPQAGMSIQQDNRAQIGKEVRTSRARERIEQSPAFHPIRQMYLFLEQVMKL